MKFSKTSMRGINNQNERILMKTRIVPVCLLAGMLFSLHGCTPTNVSPPAVTTVEVEQNTSSTVTETVGLTYEAISDTTCRVVSYIGSDTRVIIPTRDNGDRLVVAIGAGAFEANDTLTSVKLPLSVQTIEAAAFRGCSALTSVEWPAHLISVEDHAFSDCIALTSVHLPSDLTAIGNDAFAGCSSLSRITVAEDNTSFASDGQVLTSKNGSHLYLTAAAGGMQEFKSETALVSISPYAFAGHKTLKTVELTDSVTEIGDYAFSDCPALTSVRLGNGITTLPDGCFRRSKGLTNLSLPTSLVSIGASAFDGCTALSEIPLPATITAVGIRTFAGTAWLKEQTDEFVVVGNGVLIAWNGTTSAVTLPEGITFVSDAFHGSDVTSVVLPNSLSHIGENAFRSCDDLQEITLPSGLASIGQSAFYGCTALRQVNGLTDLSSVTVATGNDSLTDHFH
jgi:hypothetical protein